MTLRDSPYLFVYGTLRCEVANRWSEFLAGAASRIGSGRVHGVLFKLDSYPGMVLEARESDCVVGEVWRLNRPVATWPTLDEYEGCGPADPPPHEFERQILPVKMDDGTVRNAWVYVYQRDVSDKTRIPSGDYLEALS